MTDPVDVDQHSTKCAVLKSCLFADFAGWERFYKDIEHMLGYKISRWWMICWRFIDPVLIIVSLLRPSQLSISDANPGFILASLRPFSLLNCLIRNCALTVIF